MPPNYAPVGNALRLDGRPYLLFSNASLVGILAESLDVSCFFVNPYHSWERGLNVDQLHFRSELASYIAVAKILRTREYKL